MKHSKKLIFLFLAISGGAGILTQGSTKRNNWIFQITIKIVILWIIRNGGDEDNCITPQYKPAEEALREYYGGKYRLPKPPG